MSQIHRVPFKDQSIGQGFNTLTGEALGFPFAEPGTTPVGGDGQIGQVSVRIITTHEEMMDSLNLSVSESAHYGLFSEDGKFKLAQSSSFNSTSTFIVASQVIQNPALRGTAFNLVPQANGLLQRGQTDEFRSAFGDSFVRLRQDGGEFYAVLQITSVSSRTQSQLAASLQADVQGLVAGASFEADFQTSNQHEETKSSFSGFVYQKGGQGADLAPTFSANDVINRLKAFPTAVQQHPVTYEVEVATYETVPLPLPTPQQIEARLETLQDCARQKLTYETFRNDIEFAMIPANQVYFVNSPDAGTMATRRDNFIRVIGAILQYAAKVSTGEVPATLFTPTNASMCNPPFDPRDLTPLAFTRAPDRTPPPDMVTIPDWSSEEDVDRGGTNPATGERHPSADELGLRINFIPQAFNPVSEEDESREGEVVKLEPPAGSKVTRGSTVNVTVLGR